MQGVQVFQSTDSGEHWEQVFSLKEIVEAKQLVINPSNPLHLLIPARNGLWQSIDGGKQWEQVFTGSEPARAIINSANPKIVYFTDRRALYSLTDGKTKKISLPGAPEDSEIYGLINRTRTNQIFIFALKEVEKFRYKTKIYQVEENKANQIASINNNNRILDLIFDSHNPNILYAFSYSEIYKLNLLGNLSHR